MTEVRISEDAFQDLNEGFLFYEAQEAGLGDYFSACLRADIEGLKVSAGVHRLGYRDYHRLLSKVFPYGIFYTTDWMIPLLASCSSDFALQQEV